jgi:hypothetical protein
VSQWIQTQIVSSETKETRVNLLVRFVRMAKVRRAPEQKKVDWIQLEVSFLFCFFSFSFCCARNAASSTTSME